MILLAHASLATLDIGVTAFLFAGFLALYRLAVQPHWKWALAAGALFGFALASKFVALFFLPLIPLLLAVEWKPKKRRGGALWEARRVNPDPTLQIDDEADCVCGHPQRLHVGGSGCAVPPDESGARRFADNCQSYRPAASRVRQVGQQQ